MLEKHINFVHYRSVLCLEVTHLDGAHYLCVEIALYRGKQLMEFFHGKKRD